MKGAYLASLLGSLAALCAACDPGPTVYLGKREVATAEPADAGAEAGHSEEDDREDERESLREEALLCRDASCPQRSARCDASATCVECSADSDCEDDARCDRSQGRCVDAT